jgi:hypothetical protein
LQKKKQLKFLLQEIQENLNVKHVVIFMMKLLVYLKKEFYLVQRLQILTNLDVLNVALVKIILLQKLKHYLDLKRIKNMVLVEIL